TIFARTEGANVTRQVLPPGPTKDGMIRRLLTDTSMRSPTRIKTQRNQRRTKATERRMRPKFSNRRIIRHHLITQRRSKKQRAIRSPDKRVKRKKNPTKKRNRRKKMHPRRRPERSAARRQVLPPNSRIKGMTAKAIRAPAPLKASSPAKGHRNLERLRALKDRRVNRPAARRVQRKARKAKRAVPAASPATCLE